jgi:hypothetical protein
MTSAYKIQSNRRNAQRSTGPKTTAGKERARSNALQHGLSAKSLILPDEDPEAFARHRDGCIASLRPRDEVEHSLAETFVLATWRRLRCVRAETGLTARYMRFADLEEESRERLDVHTLGCRLFWDPRGDSHFYPHDCDPSESAAPTCSSWSGNPDDPSEPARILIQLESTLTGCRWLLERWAELKELLRAGQSWHAPEKFKAVRLLGKQPLDAVDQLKVAQIFLASHVADPQYESPFHELGLEFALESEKRRRFLQRVQERYPDAVWPKNEAEARQALATLVDTAIDRLEEIAACHQERAEYFSETAELRRAFDPGEEAERVRRYERACTRDMFRALDEIDERRRVALPAAGGWRRDQPDELLRGVWPPIDWLPAAGANSAAALKSESGQPQAEFTAYADSNGCALLSTPVEHGIVQPAGLKQECQNEAKAACKGEAESQGHAEAGALAQQVVGEPPGRLTWSAWTQPAGGDQWLDELTRMTRKPRRERTRQERHAQRRRSRRLEAKLQRERGGRERRKADEAGSRIASAAM